MLLAFGKTHSMLHHVNSELQYIAAQNSWLASQSDEPEPLVAVEIIAVAGLVQRFGDPVG